MFASTVVWIAFLVPSFDQPAPPILSPNEIQETQHANIHMTGEEALEAKHSSTMADDIIIFRFIK